jgi:hypothetical protein
MTLRERKLHVLLIGVFGLLAPAAAARGQAIVVTARSTSELADDLEYLIKSVAPDDDPTVRAALDALNNFKAGAMIKGLDRDRGFGLAVSFPEGGAPSVVAAVPVSDLRQLLDSLKDLGLTVDDQPGVAGFSHKLSVGDGAVTLFVLQSKGYALFSLTPDGADRIRALDPSSWWRKVRPATAMSVKVRLAEVPDGFKDLILNQMEAQVDKDRERQPGESEAEYRGRLAGEKAIQETFKTLMRDGDAIALDLDLDRKTSELAIELAVTSRPGTPMAKSLKAFNEKRSRFQGLSPDAALAAWARLPIAREFRDLMTQTFDKQTELALKKLDSPERKDLLTRFNELVKTNLNAPEIDLGLALRRAAPAGPGASHIVILGGMSLRDGRAVERLVRDAVAEIKPEEGFKVTFDVARAADGTAIHQITGPADEKDANMVKHFGKPSLCFAFRGDALLVAFGEDSLAPLRRAIEGPQNPAASGSDGPVALVARVAALGEIAGENQEALRQAAAKVFRGEGAKHDRISLGLKGEGDGLRLRLAIDVPALKLMTLLGSEMQK